MKESNYEHLVLKFNKVDMVLELGLRFPLTPGLYIFSGIISMKTLDPMEAFY